MQVSIEKYHQRCVTYGRGIRFDSSFIFVSETLQSRMSDTQFSKDNEGIIRHMYVREMKHLFVVDVMN